MIKYASLAIAALLVQGCGPDDRHVEVGRYQLSGDRAIDTKTGCIVRLYSGPALSVAVHHNPFENLNDDCELEGDFEEDALNATAEEIEEMIGEAERATAEIDNAADSEQTE